MANVAIYENDAGQCVILIPTPEALQTMTLQQIIDKDIPNGKAYSIIDDATLPDIYFRDAWEADTDNDQVLVTTAIAKQVRKDKLKAEYQVDAQAAFNIGDTVGLATIHGKLAAIEADDMSGWPSSLPTLKTYDPT